MEFRQAFQCLGRTAAARWQPPARAITPSPRLFSTCSHLLAPPRASSPISRSAPAARSAGATAPSSDKAEQKPNLFSAPAPWDVRPGGKGTTNAAGTPKQRTASPTTTSPLSEMLSSDDPASIATFTQFKIDGFWENYAKKRELPALRLKPSTGRTVYVSGHVDVARSFQLLTTLCRRNKVSLDLARQRFHERPGLKRKRLRSERWRGRFKEGFKATCARVQELRKQGW